jgi:hypothetical protein
MYFDRLRVRGFAILVAVAVLATGSGVKYYNDSSRQADRAREVIAPSNPVDELSSILKCE